MSSVLVVSLGRLGDIKGRVRMYNLGFVIYTAASLLLAIDWMHGTHGADFLIGMRVVQGVSGAFLIANSAAILTAAFPANQRGLALGISNVAGACCAVAALASYLRGKHPVAATPGASIDANLGAAAAAAEFIGH